MKKSLTKKQFAILLLAKLAEKSPITYLEPNKKDIKTCCLPATYKQNIENILCAQNGWAETFSCLINVDEYFKNHFAWEREFSKALKEALSELKKDYTYDFYTDHIKIDFTEAEVDQILSKCPKTTQEQLDHFANLIDAYMYTRDSQENFHDHSAKAVQYMRELKEGKLKPTDLTR